MTDVTGTWAFACEESRLELDAPIRVDLAGTLVAVVRTGDGVFAVADTCSHAQWSLSDGEVSDCTIECSLHGARFDLCTGQPSGLPAVVPIATFATKIEDGAVLVNLPL